MFVSLYVCFLVLHRICVGYAYFLILWCFIECMFGWSFALLCDHCSNFYMTVFGVWSSCSHASHHVYLIAIYLLHYTCHFFYLLYLEGLMWFVQVFQVTSLYVPSASQLFIILKGREILSTFNLYCLSLYSVFCALYPCCFCKL